MIIIGVRLKLGEFFGSIYINQKIGKKNNLDVSILKNSMQEFEIMIRETLEKQKIKNVIDFEKKGLKNIGTGCVFIPSIMGKMVVFTQKEAEFYFKIKKEQNSILKINLMSIPKISGKIKFEDTVLQEFSLASFSEKKISLKIKNELIEHEISKIKISVDKCWNIHHIFKIIPNFPLGVGIRSIIVES
jgi:hypothetical protein